MNDASSQRAGVESSIANAQAALTAAKNELNSLPTNVEATNSETAKKIQAMLAEWNNKIAALNNQIASLDSQINDLANTIAALDEQVTSATNINQPLHTDYLNYRMKTIERRHKNLTHATPHKLRHTGATLARQSGTSLEQISEALTHSDTNITKTYVNIPNVIKMPVGEIAYRKLSQNIADRNGVNSKKDASQSELRNA